MKQKGVGLALDIYIKVTTVKGAVIYECLYDSIVQFLLNCS